MLYTEIFQISFKLKIDEGKFCHFLSLLVIIKRDLNNQRYLILGNIFCIITSSFPRNYYIPIWVVIYFIILTVLSEHYKHTKCDMLNRLLIFYYDIEIQENINGLWFLLNQHLQAITQGLHFNIIFIKTHWKHYFSYHFLFVFKIKAASSPDHWIKLCHLINLKMTEKSRKGDLMAKQYHSVTFQYLSWIIKHKQM